MPKLKPCPFCGGEGEYRIFSNMFSNMSVSVMCKECRAGTKNIAVDIKYCAQEKAAEAWNRRVNDG